MGQAISLGDQMRLHSAEITKKMAAPHPFPVMKTLITTKEGLFVFEPVTSRGLSQKLELKGDFILYSRFSYLRYPSLWSNPIFCRGTTQVLLISFLSHASGQHMLLVPIFLIYKVNRRRLLRCQKNKGSKSEDSGSIYSC